MKKYLFNTSFILPAVFMLSGLSSEALQIVYPKTQNHRTYADSIFFVGNTTVGSSLKINEKEAKVYDNGAFVEVIELKDGVNNIAIESINGSEIETVTYVVRKEKKSTSFNQQKIDLEEFPVGEYLYVASIKNNVPLREFPNNNSKRITHISKDTVLMVNGKQGNFYRVSLNPEKNVWVQSDNVVNYSSINTKMLSTISDAKISEDKLYTYIKTELSFPVPFVITETDCGLNMDLYNIKEHPADTKIFKPTNTIQSLAINTIQSDNQSTYYVELTDKLWGYDAYYEGNLLVLKIRKTPQIDAKNPLKNITIAIDPGHGGKDAGAIGPTGVKEKDINLDISLKLKKVLEDSGANVFMTREDDSELGLYNRVDMVKKSDALIFLSIHANALPDGANPYKKHGTSVFYYNKESKNLAEIIKKSMLEDLRLRDDGTCFGNFVVTRTTIPLSVLIETAYMINPNDYALLLDDDFKKRTAESIKRGIESYLLNSININNVQK